MPRRVQMTRARPWRCDHPDAVIVARPGKWGNPFAIGVSVGGGASFTCTAIATRKQAVDAFEEMLSLDDRNYPSNAEIVAELAGRDLACWCPLDVPCHADILLKIANGYRS